MKDHDGPDPARTAEAQMTPVSWIHNKAPELDHGVRLARRIRGHMPKSLRTLAEINADIVAIETAREGPLDGLRVGDSRA